VNPQQKKAYVVTDDESKLMINIETKVQQLLMDYNEGTLKRDKGGILGKRKSMSDCVGNIITRESNWTKWKDVNRTQTFEKPISTKVKDRKRDAKRQHKVMSNPILAQATSRDLNFPKRVKLETN
jgi:hypothetical protein